MSWRGYSRLLLVASVLTGLQAQAFRYVGLVEGIRNSSLIVSGTVIQHDAGSIQIKVERVLKGDTKAETITAKSSGFGFGFAKPFPTLEQKPEKALVILNGNAKAGYSVSHGEPSILYGKGIPFAQLLIAGQPNESLCAFYTGLDKELDEQVMLIARMERISGVQAVRAATHALQHTDEDYRSSAGYWIKSMKELDEDAARGILPILIQSIQQEEKMKGDRARTRSAAYLALHRILKDLDGATARTLPDQVLLVHLDKNANPEQRAEAQESLSKAVALAARLLAEE